MDTAALREARGWLHVAAERILAVDLWQRTGRIGLVVHPGGFAQPATFDGSSRHRLRVDAGRILRLDGDRETVVPSASLDEALDYLALPGDVPSDFPYTPVTRAELAPTRPNPTAVTAVGDWLMLGWSAVEMFRREFEADRSTVPQLWPEHFDLSATIDGHFIGTSPGDDEIDVPYGYFAPVTPVARDRFWSASFGAATRWSAVASPGDLVEFFHVARRRVTGTPGSGT